MVSMFSWYYLVLVCTASPLGAHLEEPRPKEGVTNYYFSFIHKKDFGSSFVHKILLLGYLVRLLQLL
jgi:hypothetical protein